MDEKQINLAINGPDVLVAPGIWQSPDDYEANMRFDEARDEALIDELCK